MMMMMIIFRILQEFLPVIPFRSHSRQSGGERKANPDQVIWVKTAPSHAVASWDKTLYNKYLFLVALNKQQIQWTRI